MMASEGGTGDERVGAGGGGGGGGVGGGFGGVTNGSAGDNGDAAATAPGSAIGALRSASRLRTNRAGIVRNRNREFGDCNLNTTF